MLASQQLKRAFTLLWIPYEWIINSQNKYFNLNQISPPWACLPTLSNFLRIKSTSFLKSSSSVSNLSPIILCDYWLGCPCSQRLVTPLNLNLTPNLSWNLKNLNLFNWKIKHKITGYILLSCFEKLSLNYRNNLYLSDNINITSTLSYIDTCKLAKKLSLSINIYISCLP